MNCSIATVFSELYTPFLATGIIQKATQKKLLSFDVCSFFDYVDKKERIDAPTFGHGPGMLIKPDVVEKFIIGQEGKHGRGLRIFFSPHGQILDQKLLRKIVEMLADHNDHLVLVAARYEGIDARVEEEYADLIVSLGQFVLMGGDLPALTILEGIVRLIPAVLGNEQSFKQDSFSDALVDHPEFTHPVIWNNRPVPDVVRSGNHEKLSMWRLEKAIERTVQYHFDWLRRQPLSIELKKRVQSTIPAHYVGLLHNDIIVDSDGRLGHTSITSMDIHDIARSSRTYGVKHYFLVSELYDQQKIAEMLLGFWKEGFGAEYNQGRHEALLHTSVIDTIDSLLLEIEKREGKKPIVVMTSARSLVEVNQKMISYNDHMILWKEKRPILLLFGTGKGIAEKIIQKADFVLEPIVGLSSFNHLSVRSAVAVILDRLLGLYSQ